MAVDRPFWKRWLCYISCEWFTKPLFGKRLCVCIYDIAGYNKKVKREHKGKDGGLVFFRLPRSIAVIGLDGAGKTHHTRRIAGYFSSLCISYTVIHMPSAVPISKLKSAKRMRASEEARLAKAGWCGPVTVFFRTGALFLGIVWVYLARILPSWVRGRIVISDRWFFDELIHIRYRRMCVFPGLARRLIPSPKLLIYLRISPDIAFERAEEESIGYFLEKKVLYDNLAKDERAVIIDVEDEKEKTWEKIRGILEKSTAGLVLKKKGMRRRESRKRRAA